MTKKQSLIVKCILLCVITFVPLALPRGDVNIDEITLWVERSHNFLEAVRTGNFADTVQTEHPGVTTMWLGSIGHIILESSGQNTQLLPYEVLQFLRLFVHVTHALIFMLSYIFLRPLFGDSIAYLTCIIWALSPYLRWYNHILHVDGLVTSFMFLSMICIMLAWRLHELPSEISQLRHPNWIFLFLGAIVCGLAGLTRMTGFFVIGMFGITGLVSLSHYRKQMNVDFLWLRLGLPVTVFVFVSVFTWIVLYPGMWTNVTDVVKETWHGVMNSTSLHEGGNFFWGEALPLQDPGGRVYLVNMMLRLTPWAILGLLFGIPLFFKDISDYSKRKWIIIVLFVVFYFLFLTFQSKKLIRYIVPIFPFLYLISSLGLVWFVKRILSRFAFLNRNRQLIYSVSVLIMLTHSLSYYPHEFAYSNPILGGGQVLQQTVLLSGGEGLFDVAQDIISELDKEICTATIYTAHQSALEAYIPCAEVVWATSIEDFSEITNITNTYVIWHIGDIQRQREAYINSFDQIEPSKSFYYHGALYAELYEAKSLANVEVGE